MRAVGKKGSLLAYREQAAATADWVVKAVEGAGSEVAVVVVTVRALREIQTTPHPHARRSVHFL